MNKQKILSILKNTAAIIVMLAMLVIIFYQNRDRDFFKFGRDESTLISQSEGENSSQGYTKSDVKPLGDKVCYVTTSSYSFLDEKGKGNKLSIALSEPTLHTEGEYALCYNKNSLEFTVFKRDREYYTVNVENRIICAKVSGNGYSFVATEKEGYNCECSVYNRSGEPIFKWDISKSEFLDGDVNYDNKAIAISLASSGEEKLLGEVILIDITDAKVIEKKSFESQLFYTVDFNKNGTYTALGSNCLVYFNADGTPKWSYDYNSDTLYKADVSNPDMMVVAFSQMGSGIKGNSTKVVVLNRLGKIIGERSFDGITDDISVSEDNIAFAFGRNIYVTNSALEDRKNIKSETGVKKIALFKDNKHLFVIGASQASIITAERE
ncbi:MAG: hypothetical protein IJE41_00800 [Clostridia bacterium]|nr:hypothetical protein [Clostridia bacterium]